MRTKGHWIIITQFFWDIFLEFMKKEEMNSQSDKVYLKLIIELVCEWIK